MLGILAAQLWACSSEVTTGGGNAGGNGGSGAGGGDGGSGAGGSLPITCSSSPGDHGGVCPGPLDCAIVIDREITCTDPQFAKLGAHVVTAPAHSYLGASSWDLQALFEVTESDAKRLELFPLRAGSTMLLAADPKGALAAAADETTPASYDGGLSLARGDGGGFVAEPVFDAPDRYVTLFDLAFDTSGAAHVWYSSKPPAERSVGRRGADGAWIHEVVPSPGAGWYRFALSNEGRRVAFGLDELASGDRQLLALYDGAVRPMGAPLGASSPPRYRPIGIHASAPEGLPAFGAALLDREGLRVVWTSGGGHVEKLVPGTAAPAYQCSLGFGGEPPPCAADCHEKVSGLEYEAFAAAFGKEEVWLAVIESHLDYTVAYAPQDIDGMQICVGNVASEASTSELHLLRVPLDGSAPEKLLSLPLPGIDRDDIASSSDTDASAVAIHVAGDALTVSARLLPKPGEPKIRVLRVDTKILAGGGA
jgi:hypothetical protein